MRVLIMNVAVAESALPGASIENLTGVILARGNLWAPREVNLHEFDAVIVDAAEIEQHEKGEGRVLTTQIQELVAGGGLVICFAARADLGWLPPGSFEARGQRQGQRIRLLGHPLLDSFLERFRPEMSYDCDFQHPRKGGWTPIATTMAGYPIAGVAESNHVLVLPRFRRLDRVVAALFRDIVPQIIPDRIFVQEPLAEEPPSWLSEFSVPGVKKLDEEVAAVDERLTSLEQEKEQKVARRAQLSEFQGLLWLKGRDYLEPTVQRALELLGVPCKREEPRDLVYRGKGGPLYLEVEGSDSTIDVDKGRQLLSYIADSEDDPASIKGAIIGNPFRQHHPSDRPPAANRPLFSPPLQKLAEKQGWPLITTVQLFDLVCRHLNGDKEATRDLRRLLGLPLR